ncbi:hypothetical protein [Streptobacillus canis]|uniref:hypothetical protein n=1 Tax=Streptobacillus canis TaxID=2678686 RepID=UPI0012E29567|nr:hypothetical protein [Streptobacillus canis]
MKKIIIMLMFLVFSLFSCSTVPKISAEDIKVMTTRTYQKSMKDVYYATRDMIVEKEFNIITSNIDDGFIKGYTEIQTSDESFNVLVGSKVFKNLTIDAVLTPIDNGVKVRLLVSEQFKSKDGIGILDVLSFNFKTSKEHTTLTPIYNVELYNKLFDLIENKINK